jgi:HEAT repeat protein
MSNPASAEESSGRGQRPTVAEATQLLESKDAYQRQLGFLRLEALRDPSTAATVRRYVDSPEPDTRAFSLRAVAAIEGAKALPLLVERLQRDKHPRVRRAALLGLEPFQPSHHALVDVFIKALHDRNTAVRMTAIDIVSRIDAPQARDALLKRARRERDRDVRRVLKLALERIEAP